MNRSGSGVLLEAGRSDVSGRRGPAVVVVGRRDETQTPRAHDQGPLPPVPATKSTMWKAAGQR